jgi:hypothetical protein
VQIHQRGAGQGLQRGLDLFPQRLEFRRAQAIQT